MSDVKDSLIAKEFVWFLLAELEKAYLGTFDDMQLFIFTLLFDCKNPYILEILNFYVAIKLFY